MTLLLPPQFSPPVAAATLAQQPTPDAPGGQGQDFGKSSPMGLVLIILFFIAVALLVRSMNKHLRRVPESFDPPRQDPPQDSTGHDSGSDGRGDR
jgi:hypothetical protein